MKITQISVFLENRKGRLLDVTSLFAENNINIIALTIAETEDFGILRVVTDDPQKALQLLKQNNFAANTTDIVVVKVEDQVGGLQKMLKIINKGNLNIEYMYGFSSKKSCQAYMVFRFDDPDASLKYLHEKDVNVVKSDVCCI